MSRSTGLGASLRSFLLGFVPTVVVLGVLVGASAVAWTRWQTERARRGWVLVPKLSAARSLEEGTRLTAEDLLARDVPELIATADTLDPPQASELIGHELQVPLDPGEVLRRWHVTPRAAGPSCATLVHHTATRLGLDGDPQVAAFLLELDGSLGGRSTP